MRALRPQYFLAFAVLGSLMPYVPVFLSSKGLSDAQVGDVTSVLGVAIMLGPVLTTLLADLRLESRTLLAASFVLGAVWLTALLWAEGFWPLLIAYGLYAVAYVPIIPLQDGLNFTIQQRRREAGETPVPYHRVRVYGTFGFIVPSLVLYVWLSFGADVGVTLVVAVAFSLLGALNTLRLPHTRLPGESTNGALPADIPTPRSNGDGNASSERARRRLPTLEAARTILLQRPVLVFCLSAWLCQLAAAAYYTFYPIYLTRQIGVGEEWVGLIANLGVAIEAVFMLGFGWLLRTFGLRALMTTAALTFALRTLLLFLFPNIWVAVGTQVLHGMTVLLIHVAPPVYLNQRAGASYRSSMQGLYSMLVYGTGRIVGNMIGGRIAEVDLLLVFAVSAGLCAVAAAMFLLAFNDDSEATRQTV